MENSTIVNQSALDDSYGDQYETVREQFIHELSLLPSRLIALHKELENIQELRRTNQLLSQENLELSSDIQDLVTENLDLILDNERFAKVVKSQQQKIQELEEDLERILLARDDFLNCEEKKLDSEYKLKFKIHAAALERAQLLSVVHRLEEERDDMSEKIKILLEEKRWISRQSTTCILGNYNEDYMATATTAIKHSKENEGPQMNRSSFTHVPLFRRLAPRSQKLDAYEHNRTRDTEEACNLTQEAPLYFSRRRSENDLKEKNRQNCVLDWIRSEKRLTRAKSFFIHPKCDNDNSKNVLEFFQSPNDVVEENDYSFGFTDLSSQNSITEESRPFHDDSNNNIFLKEVQTHKIVVDNSYLSCSLAELSSDSNVKDEPNPTDNDDNFQVEGTLLVEFGCEESIVSDCVSKEHAFSENDWTRKY